MKKLYIFFILTSLLFGQNYSPNKCMGCHGGKGEKPAFGKSKILNKMTEEEIKKALKGYQNKNYGGKFAGLMYGQIKGATDKEISLLAKKFAKTD
jgi:cytochrome c553